MGDHLGAERLGDRHRRLEHRPAVARTRELGVGEMLRPDPEDDLVLDRRRQRPGRERQRERAESAVTEPFERESFACSRFIAGEPMKRATNASRGRS